MGGARGVLHYMQRTAVQGSPAMVTAITREWSKGALTKRRTSNIRSGNISTSSKWAIQIVTGTRLITLEDVVNFANLSGDKFYAHMNDEDARSNGVFTGRVAHGYFIVSAAAGLFVDPAHWVPCLPTTGWRD